MLTKNSKRFTGIFLLILNILTFFCASVCGQEIVNWEAPFIKCWEFSTSSRLNEKVASDNESNIILATGNNLLVSINPKDGEEIWRNELGGSLESKPISDGKDIFLIINIGTGSDSKKLKILRSINSNTGITNWQVETDSSEKSTGYLFSRYFFSIGEDGLVITLDKTTGKNIWSKKFLSEIYSFTGNGSEEILVSTAGRIFELSAKDGRTLQEWQVPTGDAFKLLNIKDKKIIWGNHSGEIFCFDLADNSIIWRVKTGGSISSLAQTERGILATSFDNFAYLFSSKNGKIIWKKRLAGRINIEPLIIMDYVVMVSSGDSIALIIDLGSGKTINQINIGIGDFFSGSPGIWKNLIILQTFRGIWAFSNLACTKKEAVNK